MKRSRPLRTDPAKVRAWQQRSRQPLAQRSAKAAADEAEYQRNRAARRAQAGGWCEGATPACRPGAHLGHLAHHVRRRKGQPDVHAVEWLRWLCFDAHDWVHANVAEARQRGLLA